jgi:hypothetical protein
MTNTDPLTEKLRAIVGDIYSSGNDDDDLEFYGDFDDVIAEIHQAYKEAGYYKPQIFSENAGSFTDATGGYTDIRMTAAEWLDRFKAELDKTPGWFLGDDGQLHVDTKGPWIGKGQVIHVARRAAGVSG